MKPRRPLRSVMLCNPRYLSTYVLGVGQAMGLRGDWHRVVSIFDDSDGVARQIAEMAPDVIWTHAAMWPPVGAVAAEVTHEILARWKRRGAIVFLHDGDPRERTLTVDVPAAFSMALVNRTVDTSRPWWGIPAIRWPYAAMVQREIAPPTRIEHDLLFAGILRRDEDLYGDRTALVYDLQRRLWPRMQIVSPGGGDANNRMQVADVIGTTHAVLGFGRPNVPGWVDTRVFQYPGAGGVLIHDDAGDVLAPNEHFLKFARVLDGDGKIDIERTVDSILACVERAKAEGPAIRARAFAHIQAHHTWRHRVEQALAPFFGAA